MSAQCPHGNSMPSDILESLPDRQAGLGRHKCAICAFNEGIKVANGQAIFGVEGEELDGEYAPLDMLEGLAENQGGAGRHKCVYRAYQEGITHVIDTDIGDTPIINPHKPIPENTEKRTMQKSRIGQDIFRGLQFSYWNASCPMTGITDRQLLRASHIKPWADCTDNKTRLDTYNGLLLSSLWDAAFDSGLVSFEDSGVLMVSSRLTDKAKNALGVATASTLPVTAQHSKFLAWHRTEIFSR